MLDLSILMVKLREPEEIIRSPMMTTESPLIEEIITEDGILSTILSSLTLREAVRTSVLSSRWRHIWTSRTKFEFNAVTLLDAPLLDIPLPGREAYDETKGKITVFIRAVDSVLQQHQGTRIDTFMVRYFLDKSHSHHLDEWVRFAVASKTIVLRFHLFKPFSDSVIEPYEFPCHLLGPLSTIETLSLIFCAVKLPCKFDGFSSLKILAMANVYLNEEDFSCIIYNCSSTLVKLGVCENPRWESISIPHPLNKLQFLVVRDCEQLRKIEVNAVNLLELDYRGVPLDFRFRQSSNLKKAHICFEMGELVHSLDFYLTNLSNGLPQLQSLTLKISGASVSNLAKEARRFIHLKHLNLEWNVGVEMSLLHLTTLLGAAPFLEELKLCFSTHAEDRPSQTPQKSTEMIPKHPHIHLKTIEISDSYFTTWQTEIVRYLLNNATKLESMTIKSSQSVPANFSETCIKGLSQQVATLVKLVIL